ncbi:hypothetical protein DL93DRAFT_2071621 [Clavulina sp. PMI_390]|nr:hypothetical protein DL93DRAFT_2071621 [Clavulina sp. PMI_390]
MVTDEQALFVCVAKELWATKRRDTQPQTTRPHHVTHPDGMQLRSVLLWGLASSQRKRKLSSRAVINTVSAYPNSTLPLNQDLLANDECEPLSIPVEQQCSHVQATCPQSDTLLHVSYPDAYFCAPPAARPFAFVGLLLWLLFLFSFIGIAASDFFIPNLATLADVFGLDDNIAGVTFLAFGNGSPDLFSTLSAMRAGSGSLAIGELIGAASFIVSVVAGSMCVIQSFHVNPVPFLRDVGFFAVSMGMLFWILFDGLIEAWEAALLAGLYICYVIVVVLSTWWDKRRERKERSLHEARRAFERDDIPSIFVEPYQDERESSSTCFTASWQSYLYNTIMISPTR